MWDGARPSTSPYECLCQYTSNFLFCDLLVIESSGRTLLLLARSQRSQAQQRTEPTVGCKAMGARTCKAESTWIWQSSSLSVLSLQLFINALYLIVQVRYSWIGIKLAYRSVVNMSSIFIKVKGTSVSVLFFVRSSHSRGCCGRCHKANNWPVPYFCLHIWMFRMFVLCFFSAWHFSCQGMVLAMLNSVTALIQNTTWCIAGRPVARAPVEAFLQDFFDLRLDLLSWNLKIVLVWKKSHFTKPSPVRCLMPIDGDVCFTAIYDVFPCFS